VSTEIVDLMRLILVMAVGAGTGFLGGLFGKGGSAIATPLLHLVGVPAYAAVASPLPATIPATIAAALAYHRSGWIDRAVLRTTVLFGVPATVVGALATRFVSGPALILVCDAVVALLGLRVLLRSRRDTIGSTPDRAGAGHRVARVPADLADPSDSVVLMADPPAPTSTVAVASTTVAAVGIAVGLASGLLANSGGFLLAPLFVAVLGLPLKRALGTSLAASAFLAVPGTIVHVALGHVIWSVAIPFGLASVPLAATGARLALRTSTARLERVYGTVLLLLGTGLLLVR